MRDEGRAALSGGPIADADTDQDSGSRSSPAAGQHWQGDGWSLTRSAEGFLLTDQHGQLRVSAAEAGRVRVTRQWWRTRVAITGCPEQDRSQMSGLSRAEGAALATAVRECLLEAITAWTRQVDDTLARARADLRWVPQEDLEVLIRTRPDTTTVPDGVGDERTRRALETSAEEVTQRVRQVNEGVATATLTAHRGFFETIESRPLTDEQARAVLAYDNRVLVVAGAGSGKTSVMVARAAWAVHRGLARPDQILLLAFNRAAATELQERIQDRFAAAGIPSAGVRASTFHAFGLDVITQATSRRPQVAPWVVDGQELTVLADIVAALRETDPSYGAAWDAYRLLFARTGESPTDDPDPDAWDTRKRKSGLRTLNGEIVRSQGERIIADWLYLNGIAYEHEAPYPHPTGDDSHRQYHPDFYLPQVDAWLEHWGIDEHGNPPPEWTGYKAGMTWKRKLHAHHKTTLLETTWAGVMAGTGLQDLTDQLRRRGTQPRWNPARAGTTRAGAMTDADLLALVRTFLTHVKANGLTRTDVEERLSEGRVSNRGRTRRFLDLFWPIHTAWQDRLQKGGYVDFEDMLTQAADHLETSTYTNPYTLVMVDEFQDASQARARLTRALLDAPGRHLLAVGDDWQSINRFAGADVSLMTSFNDHFGPGPTLHLSTTFRSHQSITEAASAFVAKNPHQHAKTVTSIHTHPARAEALQGVHLRQVAHPRDIPGAIATYLGELATAIDTGALALPDRRMVTVDVLGRYRHDQQLLPSAAHNHLRVRFRTIHASKGLEADFVIVPNLQAGTHGFPSTIRDDPVLALAMTQPENYPHAEERRLLYVALTRARHGVVLLAPATTPSPFIAELLSDNLLTSSTGAGVAALTPCPTCGQGVLRQRTGRHGTFWGCSAFPRCTHATAAL